MARPIALAAVFLLAVSASACASNGAGEDRSVPMSAPPNSSAPPVSTSAPPTPTVPPPTPTDDRRRLDIRVLSATQEGARGRKGVVITDAKTATANEVKPADVDFTRDVVVGLGASTGCAAPKEPQEVQLWAKGDSVYLFVATEPPLPECFTDFQTYALFVVPKDQMPAKPKFS